MLAGDEARSLLNKDKIFVDDAQIILSAGARDARELESVDREDAFMLDYYRGSLKLSKLRHQLRNQTTIILVRLDINGPPHTNPDGVVIGGTHIHHYREGFEDKWAEEIDASIFTDIDNMKLTLQQFCDHCNIGEVPDIVEQLML